MRSRKLLIKLRTVYYLLCVSLFGAGKYPHIDEYADWMLSSWRLLKGVLFELINVLLCFVIGNFRPEIKEKTRLNLCVMHHACQWKNSTIWRHIFWHYLNSKNILYETCTPIVIKIKCFWWMLNVNFNRMSLQLHKTIRAIWRSLSSPHHCMCNDCSEQHNQNKKHTSKTGAMIIFHALHILCLCVKHHNNCKPTERTIGKVKVV